MLTNHRIEKLQEKLREEKLDGAVYATSASLQYLLDDTTYPWQRTPETGFYVFPGTPMYSTERSYFQAKPDVLLFVPREGAATVLATYERARTMPNTPVDISCYYVMLAANLVDVVRGCKRLGVGLCAFTAIENMLKEEGTEDIACVPAEGLVEALRMIKEPKEIAALRRVAAFTDECMATICDMLRPGVTQWEVEKRLNQLGLEHGCSDVPFSPSCTFTKTSDPRCQDKIGAIPKDEPLTPGTAIAFDNGFVMDGYCSDYGRSFYCGPAPRHIADAYKALQTAQLELLDHIKPGVSMSCTFAKLHETLSRLGYGENLRNFANIGMMGHQIGIDVHEIPWLHNTTPEVFQPGMVMCIEPKLWLPGEAFMRTEDMVLITETGCESLTVFDRNCYELPLE